MRAIGLDDVGDQISERANKCGLVARVGHGILPAYHVGRIAIGSLLCRSTFTSLRRSNRAQVPSSSTSCVVGQIGSDASNAASSGGNGAGSSGNMPNSVVSDLLMLGPPGGGGAQYTARPRAPQPAPLPDSSVHGLVSF